MADDIGTRLDEHSVVGIVVSLGAVVGTGILVAVVNAPMPVQTAVVALAGGLPSAIGYHVASRRRDKSIDVARLQQGHLDRPIGLVVIMLAAALFLLDTIGGAIAVIAGNVVALVTGLHSKLVIAAFGISLLLVVLPVTFLISAYASHYFGDHPYLWTSVAVTLVVVFRFLTNWLVSTLTRQMVPGIVVVSLIYLAVALGGVWFGRRRHDRFLASMMARVQRRLSSSPQVMVAPTFRLDDLPPPDPRNRRLE